MAETKAQLEQRYAQALQVEKTRHAEELAAIQTRHKNETRILHEQFAAQAEEQGKLRAEVDQAKAAARNADSRADSERRDAREARSNLDVIRGFVMREIPMKLADLPQPIANALGIVVPY